jgi:hypothetical protein
MAKMDIFISWSGPRSRAVAEALKKYLPMIVNDFNPWLSSSDIDKGSRSSEEIARALTNARAGIICLTPNNLKEPWILFEAGAVAKTVREKPLACTLLIDLQITDVSGPLAQFQATKPTEAELLHLIQTLNKELGESAVPESQLAASFELCWPKLKHTLDNLPPDGTGQTPPARPADDMLKELLELSRQNSLGVLESHRQTIAQLTKLESFLSTVLLPRWLSAVLGGEKKMVSLSALSGQPDGNLFDEPALDNQKTGSTNSLRGRLEKIAPELNSLRDRLEKITPESKEKK